MKLLDPVPHLPAEGAWEAADWPLSLIVLHSFETLRTDRVVAGLQDAVDRGVETDRTCRKRRQVAATGWFRGTTRSHGSAVPRSRGRRPAPARGACVLRSHAASRAIRPDARRGRDRAGALPRDRRRLCRHADARQVDVRGSKNEAWSMTERRLFPYGETTGGGKYHRVPVDCL